MDSNKVLCYPGVGQLHQQAPTAPVCSRRGPQRTVHSPGPLC